MTTWISVNIRPDNENQAIAGTNVELQSVEPIANNLNEIRVVQNNPN